ncbi:MAG TPA: DUF4382 domain-containing protein [Anaerolineae bacterium]|nr:DUF4382 domain-containing protein [Anaerolineae bacterium]
MKLRLLLLLGILGLTACASPQNGTLELLANGEDFARQPFTSKDGWTIDFEHVYLTLTAVTAYQTNPPFDAASGQMPTGTPLPHPDSPTVDLANPTRDDGTLLVGTIDAPTGHYNAISWEMAPLNNNPTIHLLGTATKDDQTIRFDIQVDQTYQYACGEYVGDSRKGFVDPDTTDNLEMTFHFDHVFGDADSDLSEPLNTGALGFDPLATLATDNELIATLTDLEANLTADQYATLLDTLATLGHVGEGHCYEFTNGYTAHETE